MSHRSEILQISMRENLLRQPVLVRFRAFKEFVVLDGSAVVLFGLASDAAMLPLASSGPRVLFAGGPVR